MFTRSRLSIEAYDAAVQYEELPQNQMPLGRLKRTREDQVDQVGYSADPEVKALEPPLKQRRIGD